MLKNAILGNIPNIKSNSKSNKSKNHNKKTSKKLKEQLKKTDKLASVNTDTNSIIEINTAKSNKLNNVINIILCIILFIIPLLITPREIDTPPYNLLKIITLLLCGAILLVCVIIKIVKKEFKLDLIDKTLLVFYALIVISTIFSTNKVKALIGEDNRYEGFLTLTVYFLTYYCAKYYFNYNKKLKYFAIATVIISSVIGILQYYNIFPLYYIFNIPFKESFASSTFGNRNFFGSFLAIAVPLFMALYLIKNKKVYLVTSFIAFWGMLVSMTRSSWLGLIVVTIFGIIYIVKNYNKEILTRTIHIIIGFILIFIFVLIPSPFITNNIGQNSLFNRFLDLGEDFDSFMNASADGIDMAGSGRIHIWKLTLKGIAVQPLIGPGPDNLVDGLAHNLPYECLEYVDKYKAFFDKAHNEYLQIAATIGIPALIVYLAFVAQILGKQKNLFKDNASFIFTISIISYLVQAFLNISTIGVAPIFWCLLGLVQNEEFKKELV